MAVFNLKEIQDLGTLQGIVEFYKINKSNT